MKETAGKAHVPIRVPDPGMLPKNPLQTWGLWSGLILVTMLVRLIGPWNDVALGQTDAYGHLQFLTDMMTDGRLRHPYYPPGYYWLLAPITVLLGIDPYLVCRYVGSVFAVGLLVSLYALAKRAFGRKAALWTAYLFAVFPAFYWLQKTGVGAYPSQLGLILVPVILLTWDGVLQGRNRCWPGLLVSAVLLALSVPMMLLDLFAFMLIDAGVRGWRREFTRSAAIAICALAGTLSGGVAVIMASSGNEILVNMVYAISGLEHTGESGFGSLMRALIAYVGPERLTPPGSLATAGAAVVGLVLLVLLRMLWHQNTTTRMIGLWALFTWAQSAFGVFQFSQYMRAGWMLLVALCLLGGWLLKKILTGFPPRLRGIAQLILIGSSLLTFIHPPRPVPHLSAAEGDLVRAALALRDWSRSEASGTYAVEWVHALPDEVPIQVWSREFTGFDKHQGDPLHALLERCPNVQLSSPKTTEPSALVFNPKFTQVVLLDDRAPPPASLGLMNIVNPGLAKSFERSRSRLQADNHLLRNQVQDAEHNGWTSNHFKMEQGLDVILLRAATATP